MDGLEPAEGDGRGLDEHPQRRSARQPRGRSASRSSPPDVPRADRPGPSTRRLYTRRRSATTGFRARRDRSGRPGACRWVAPGNRSEGLPPCASRCPSSTWRRSPAGRPPSSSIAASVALAQRAEEHGYGGSGTPSTTTCRRSRRRRPACSSPTSARTRSTIRLGAGGVMLPNHSPLTIAEQFGTLDAMYPGRIDLGLGRAPGSDQNTMYALRRDPASADTLPRRTCSSCRATWPASHPRARRATRSPARARDVPLYILGSSMFGATLAAALGLPYAFASHFAPQLLEPAVAAYRREFRPSAQLDRALRHRRRQRDRRRHHGAGAEEQLQVSRRVRAVGAVRRGRSPRALTDDAGRPAAGAGRGAHVDQMLTLRRASARRPRWASTSTTFREAGRRRRADRRPPGAHDRGPAAVGGRSPPRPWEPTDRRPAPHRPDHHHVPLGGGRVGQRGDLLDRRPRPRDRGDGRRHPVPGLRRRQQRALRPARPRRDRHPVDGRADVRLGRASTCCRAASPRRRCSPR